MQRRRKWRAGFNIDSGKNLNRRYGVRSESNTNPSKNNLNNEANLYTPSKQTKHISFDPKICDTLSNHHSNKNIPIINSPVK